jgi:hypothetical protein
LVPRKNILHDKPLLRWRERENDSVHISASCEAGFGDTVRSKLGKQMSVYTPNIDLKTKSEQ